ncbi:protein LBH-like [Latimeria chalumnae]|uniref:protein LBH-like n=1 Tax=Latimeria chalumnae TaxID=7897 RepID=UPI0003C17CC2|nr:PREDICTED: protein LBH-like [Latimeria chalumnae]XP_014339452.1 PREDICTED: protein LBH-like [Latimeria chalumnae]|eukprot:XP_005988936.1 PREDICTED: protein LBH-like [Latimeria chalumnae]
MAEVLRNSCETSMESVGLKHDSDRLSVQIFPDPHDASEAHCKLKDRLPSIVVEATDVSEVESGELRWPPEDFQASETEPFFSDGEKEATNTGRALEESESQEEHSPSPQD